MEQDSQTVFWHILCCSLIYGSYHFFSVISCPMPSPPQNGNMHPAENAVFAKGSNLRYLSMVEMGCNEGFTMRMAGSSAKIMCKESGTWNTTDMSCERMYTHFGGSKFSNHPHQVWSWSEGGSSDLLAVTKLPSVMPFPRTAIFAQEAVENCRHFTNIILPQSLNNNPHQLWESMILQSSVNVIYLMMPCCFFQEQGYSFLLWGLDRSMQYALWVSQIT